jgi:hypothetical protein
MYVKVELMLYIQSNVLKKGKRPWPGCMHVHYMLALIHCSPAVDKRIFLSSCQNGQ